MGTKESTTKAPIRFTGVSAAEKPIVARIESLIGEFKQVETKLDDLAIEIGHGLFELRAIGQKDGNRYSVVLPGKTEPENVGRFDAVINSFGLSRASGWRYLRAYQEHLKDTNPVPSAITQMATTNGVLNLTEEIAQQAIADAFLAAGQPSNPTPLQCMAIVADACRRAEETPSNDLKDFKKLLSKAITFAREHNLSPEVVTNSWQSAFDPSVWTLTLEGASAEL
jgi:hypothetical protein